MPGTPPPLLDVVRAFNQKPKDGIGLLKEYCEKNVIGYVSKEIIGAEIEIFRQEKNNMENGQLMKADLQKYREELQAAGIKPELIERKVSTREKNLQSINNPEQLKIH